MRQYVLSFVILLAASLAAQAQNEPGGLQGVYGPPESSSGKLRGVYAPPQSAPAAPLPRIPSASDYGTSDRGPNVSLPGSAGVGQVLPEGVKPSPIPDRPGYGRAMVNGHRAIIDMNSNRIVQFSD